MLKPPVLAGAVTAALGLLLLFSLHFGTVSISLKETVSILLGNDRDSTAAKIIMQVRLPRIMTALLIGMMLAAGGAVSQAVFRNPLADPYIIGISAGAAAGAALAFVLKLPDLWYGVFAFALSLGASFLIFRLSGNRERTDTASLLIVGAAVSAFLGAFTAFIMYLAGQDAYRVMLWTMGYLGSATWLRVGLLSIPLLLALAYFFYRRNDIDALLLGDAEAHSLGIPVGRLKRRLLLAVSLIAAFSVAFAGMIGFVGLIVPHGIRLLAGNNHGRLIPLAAYSGGVFLLFADTLARFILSPAEIPIGVITAFFGAPFFLFLAVRNEKRSFG
jgi:iron complex transport system permease protein